MSRSAVHPAAPSIRRRRRSGFSLVELIIASVIVSFIVAATTVSLSQAIRARDSARARNEAFARATAAADRIAHDAENAVRDPVLEFTRVATLPEGDEAARADTLLLFSRSIRRVRPAIVPGGNDPPEGGECEVQYRLQPPDPEVRAAAGASPLAGMVLWRRADPVPDEFPDGGGVAAPVAEGIVSLTIQASNGLEWFDTWDSDFSGYPHAIRITVTASDDRARTTATARRTVALDRTPLPLEPVEESSEDPAADAAPTQPAGTTPSAAPANTPR